MKTVKHSLGLIFGAAVAFVGLANAHADDSVQIAAAASFTNVFNQQIIPAFTKKTGITVLPTYGATGLLARQVEAGAPYEVFVSADDTTVPKLVGEKLIDPASVKTFTQGQLVLWSKTIAVNTLGMNSLTGASIVNIAIANPKTAPYGNAAMEALTNSNLLTTLQPKIVQGENVNQALQYAQSGNADIAFTAYSLVIGGPGNTFIVPHKLYTPLNESVGVIVTASPDARKFEDYLLSKDARKLLEAAGYLKPGK